MKFLKPILICSLFFLHIWVSADYVRSIEDEFKIHVFEQQATKVLKNSKNPLEISQKYRKIIKEKLWARYDEIKYKDSIENFNEYALYRLYNALYYESFMWEYSINTYYFKILENDYFRTISRDKNLFIDNNWVYYNYHSWSRGDILTFLHIDKTTNLKEYIEKNLLEEEFVWKCEVVEKIEANFWNTKQKTYYIQYTPEYIKILKQENNSDLLKWQKCGKFWYGSIFRKTDTIVFYYPRPFEWSGEDFSLFEIKKWNE